MSNVLCESRIGGGFRINTAGYKACRQYIIKRYPRKAAHEPMLKELAGMWPEAHRQAAFEETRK